MLNCFLGGHALARPVGVARAGVGVAILLELPNSADTLLRLADPRFIRTPYATFLPVPSEPLAWLLLGLWLTAGLAFVLGAWTRVAGAVLTVALGSVLVLDQQLYSNHLYLMTLVAGLLTIADSGAALSVDAMRHGTREAVAAWPGRLLRLQVSIVYGFAAISKLNLTFLSGSVVASYLRRDGPLAVPDAWRSVEPMLILSVLAICLEAFVAVGLWVPRWQPAALVGAMALHLGISLWLSPTYQLLVYSLLMLPLLILFVPVEPRRVLVWDDSCGFCGAWVRWFRRLDWLGALRFVPRSRLDEADLPISADDAAVALQLVGPRRTQSGFAAVSGVAELLPISFLWAPLLRMAPIAALGAGVYRRVASRRTCAVPVTPV